MSAFNPRDVRSFGIYKSQHPVLTVTDEPGRLYSTAAPPPEGAPEHPFVNARAYDPYSENELGWYLQKSAHFDDFITQLIGAGYNVASQHGNHPDELNDPFRLEDADGLAGALWGTGGQFTTLAQQPETGEATFAHATLTAYRDDHADTLLKILEKTNSFSEIRQELQNAGFRLIMLAKYTV